MKNIFIITFLLVVSFTSCKRNNTAGLWFYTHSYGEVKKKHHALSPVNFLYLQPDGLYTSDLGSFEYGKWEKDKDNLVLTNAQNKVTPIPIKYINRQELKLEKGPGQVANFDLRPAASFLNELDPFSVASNQWRIKPVAKETETQIRKRLLNHCRYWEGYFLWALEAKINYIDVRSTPTPIMIYGNGFALKEYHEMPKAWVGYFYDIEDCKIANNLLYEAFRSGEIAWANSDNKYKMFVSAFQQLQQIIRRQEGSSIVKRS